MAKIQQCECGARYNVDKFKPGSRFKCKKCGAVLKVDHAIDPSETLSEIPVPIIEESSADVPVPVFEDDAQEGRQTRRGRREPREEAGRGRTRRPSSRRHAAAVPEEEEEAPRRAGRAAPARRRHEEEPEEEPARPRRRPPSGRRRAAMDEVPAETVPMRPIREEIEDFPEEPELTVDDMPDGAFIEKADYAQKRAEVMKKSPGFVVPLVVNLVVFLLCIGGGVFALKGFAKVEGSEKAKTTISEYESMSDSISLKFSKLKAKAEALGEITPESVMSSASGRYAYASAKVLKSTVTVVSDIDVFQNGEPKRIEYYGSGFVFQPEGDVGINGYIITCYENIAGARSIKVMLNNHDLYNVRVIGYDVPANIALLQLDQDEMKKRKPQLVALEWTDSDEVKKNVAQYVIGAGTPLGRSNSVALGVISCPDRYTMYTLRTGEVSGFYNQMFQTDTQINWGSSGGPLVDLDGKIVAVCVTTEGIYDAFGLQDYNGLFFAIHGNFARKIANTLKRYGRVDRSYTGIYVGSLQSLDLDREHKGTAIVGVEPESPAALAGLAPGDIITSIKYKVGGKEITSALNARHDPDIASIYDELASLPINTEVTFKVRDVDYNAKSDIKFSTGAFPKGASEVVNAAKWGLVVTPLSSRDVVAYGLPSQNGVKVVAVIYGSPAYRAGIRAGFVLLTIDDKQITDIKDFEGKYANLNSARKRDIKLEFKRNNRNRGVMGSDIMRMYVRYD